MKIEYLREFLVLLKHGNYSVAADMLFTTQASLSRHIQSMEDELGHTLFTDNRRHLELTEAGRLMVSYAEEITQAQDRYVKDLQGLNSQNNPVINIGLIRSASSYGIDSLIAQFVTSHPNIRINMMQESYKQLPDDVLSGEMDIAFVRLTDTEAAAFKKGAVFEVVPVAFDNLAVVVPETHPLYKKDSLKITDLRGENIILPPKDSPVYDLCVKACQTAGFSPSIVFTSIYGRSSFELISRGAGIGLFPQRSAADNMTPDERQIPLQTGIKMEIAMLSRSGDLSPTTKLFVSFINSKIKNLTKEGVA